PASSCVRSLVAAARRSSRLTASSRWGSSASPPASWPGSCAALASGAARNLAASKTWAGRVCRGHSAADNSGVNAEETQTEVFVACRALKKRGYMIALDDVVCDDWDNPLVGFADIIKVDFRASNDRTKAALPGLMAARKIKALVSTKVRPRGSISRPSSGRPRATPGPTGPADRPPRRPGAPGVG